MRPESFVRKLDVCISEAENGLQEDAQVRLGQCIVYATCLCFIPDKLAFPQCLVDSRDGVTSCY